MTSRRPWTVSRRRSRSSSRPQRMGVELDRDEALRWIAAMASEDASEPSRSMSTAASTATGCRWPTTSAADLARIRRVARDRGPARPAAGRDHGAGAVGLRGPGQDPALPGRLRLLRAGAHPWPPTREAALDILGEVLRDQALATLSGPGHRLWEAKWGTHDEPGTVRGERGQGGLLDLVDAGGGGGGRPGAGPGRWHRCGVIDWADAPGRPGWAKLDWLVGDRTRGILANASNVLDPTWEAPDGTIVPLDGFLDPYFQEVYLEAESIPLFTRLVAEHRRRRGGRLRASSWSTRSGSTRSRTPNHGKAARRMYNVFRLDRALRGGRLPAGAVRRAGDRAVPARGAAPDGRRRGVRGHRGLRPGAAAGARWTSSSCPPSRPSTARTRRSWWSGSSGSGRR